MGYKHLASLNYAFKVGLIDVCRVCSFKQTDIKDIYKQRNDIAVNLLPASGI